MEFRLPTPRNWQDFESLCQQLWKEIWGDANAQKNGRSGQEQCGVDVFGRHYREIGFSGVQCKDKDGRLRSVLKPEVLESECENAESFKPQLRSFTMATTAPRDAKIQELARQVTASETYQFDVHVWSWDDIEAEILARPALRDNFYSDYTKYTDNSDPKVKISISSPRDQLFAFFSRPNVSPLFPNYLQSRLVQVIYELGDNAFVHGKASNMSLSLIGGALVLEDDGDAFDPLTGLDPSKVSARSHVGSFVLHEFRKRFSEAISVNHVRANIDGRPVNRTSFGLSVSAENIATPTSIDVSIDLSMVHGRKAAQRVAQSISVPSGVPELVLTIGPVRNWSVLMEFLFQVLQRLPANAKLTISLPRDAYDPQIVTWFNDPRVSVSPR